MLSFIIRIFTKQNILNILKIKIFRILLQTLYALHIWTGSLIHIRCNKDPIPTVCGMLPDMIHDDPLM